MFSAAAGRSEVRKAEARPWRRAGVSPWFLRPRRKVSAARAGSLFSRASQPSAR